MPSLPSTIKAIDAVISEIQQQMLKIEVGSDAFFKFNEKVSELLQRRKLLVTFNDEMNERIANIRHEFEDKAAALPVIADVKLIVEPDNSADAESNELSVSTEIVSSTVQTVKKYVQMYFDDYKHVPDKNNYFHAAACSYYKKYVFLINESSINSLMSSLISKANLPSSVKYPLSLADVDKIIRFVYPDYNYIILDTSLQVILTNLSNVIKTYCYILIYDAETQKFAPIS